MAVTPVSLGPALRAWSQAGITHILCDGPLDASLAGQEGDSSVVNEPLRPPGTPLPAAFSQNESGPTGTSGTGKFGKTAARAAIPPPDSAGTQTGRELTPNVPLALPPSNTVPDDPKDWPPPWGERLVKSVPAPILWTYHELGADLLGVGGAERSAFFKSLIGELHLPRGSSVFWPSAMPDTEQTQISTLNAAPAFYAAGVRFLKPQVIVVLGNQALADMELAGRIKIFRQAMVEGRLLLLLPEIADMVRQPGLRQSGVSLLRAVFASVNFS